MAPFNLGWLRTWPWMVPYLALDGLTLALVGIASARKYIDWFRARPPPLSDRCTALLTDAGGVMQASSMTTWRCRWRPGFQRHSAIKMVILLLLLLLLQSTSLIPKTLLQNYHQIQQPRRRTKASVQYLPKPNIQSPGWISTFRFDSFNQTRHWNAIAFTVASI